MTRNIYLFKSITKEVKTAPKIKRSIKYELNYSNFTFELWIILHKKLLTAPKTDRKNYLSDINNVFGENYSSLDEYKSEKIFNLFLEKHIKSVDDVIQAVKNGKKIRQQHIDDGDTFTEFNGYKFYTNNPDTDIFKCAEKILTESGLV